VRASPGLCDDKGFIPCTDGYQHAEFPNIFAAGLAVQVKAPFSNLKTPFGVPKTGFPTDVQGKIVANNIAHRITGRGKIKQHAFGKIPGICIMDAGSKEVWILTNHLFKPRQFEIMIPNVIYNFGKRLLEKYMLYKNQLGWSFLP
jgi:sulfide:quinone oxidoreductase